VKRTFYGQVVRIRLGEKIEKQAEKELAILSNQTPRFTGLQDEKLGKHGFKWVDVRLHNYKRSCQGFIKLTTS